MFSDALNHPSVVDGCRLAGAETFVYDHGDVEHLAWGLRNADGRAALIVTEGVFALDGDTAPLEAIVALAHRFDVRVLVSEAHALGAVGPDGRGAVAAAGLRGQVDVITGSLGTALGAAGGFAACDRTLARYLADARAHVLGARPPCRRRRSPPRWRRSSCCASSRGGSRSCRPTPTCCAPSSRARASTSRAPTPT